MGNFAARKSLPGSRRVGSKIFSEDITLRALRILKEVDLIAAEDTRHTQTLLRHYDIRTRLTSYHDHNERTKAQPLIERLLRGENIALLSDAGTPAISDPGYRLVV